MIIQQPSGLVLCQAHYSQCNGRGVAAYLVQKKSSGHLCACPPWVKVMCIDCIQHRVSRGVAAWQCITCHESWGTEQWRWLDEVTLMPMGQV
jgi:hypothetical protein